MMKSRRRRGREWVERRLGQAECGSMPNYHLCALATFAALNKREAVEQGAGKQEQEQGSRRREQGAGSSSNFIRHFRSWRRGLARLINFAACCFLALATFEL